MLTAHNHNQFVRPHLPNLPGVDQRALLDVQEKVLKEFAAQVGPLPPEPEPIVLEPLAEELPEAPEVPDPPAAELVEEDDLPFADDETEAEDYWGPRGSNRM